MTTTIVFGDESDGAIGSSSTSYSTARAGANLAVDTTDTLLNIPTSPQRFPGQRSFGNTYLIAEGFLAFDLAGASIEGAIIDADLVLHQHQGFVATAYDIEARAHDWGPSLTTDDWVAGANLGTLDLLATLAATTDLGIPRTFAPNGSALVDHVEDHRDGVSRMLLNSSRHRLGNAPSGNEWTTFRSANAGTTDAPRLVIVHEGEHDIEGELLGGPTLSGQLQRVRFLSGTLAETLTAAGALERVRLLAGADALGPTLAGKFSGFYDLAGTLDAGGTLAGSFDALVKVLTGHTDGGGQIEGSLVKLAELLAAEVLGPVLAGRLRALTSRPRRAATRLELVAPGERTLEPGATIGRFFEPL